MYLFSEFVLFCIATHSNIKQIALAIFDLRFSVI